MESHVQSAHALAEMAQRLVMLEKRVEFLMTMVGQSQEVRP